MRLWNHLTEAVEFARMGAPLCPGPTGTLALVLDHAWRPGTLFVQLACYLDESGTHAQSPIYVVGGYVARLGQWRKFDEQWRKLLRAYGLTYFHAKELWSHQKEFKGWDDAKTQAFVKRATAVASANTLFGFSVVMQKADYEAYYTVEPKPPKFQLDSQYGVCFRTAVVFAVEGLRRLYPVEMGRSLVNFILEDGAPGMRDSLRIVAQLREHELRNYGRFLGTLSIDGKKRYPGLQIADATASGTYKSELGEPIVVDLSDLAASPQPTSRNGHAPVYRVLLTGKALGALRTGIFDFKDFRARHWKASVAVAAE